MKRVCNIRVVILTVLLLVLSGCSQNPYIEETAPSVQEPTTVDIGGTLIECNTTYLDLSNAQWDFDTLVAQSSFLERVNNIDLGITELNYSEVEALQSAFPTAQISYRISIFDQILTPDSLYLDASSMTAEQTDELISILPMIPLLNEINFVSADGICVYSVDTISELDKIRDLLPDAGFHVQFDLFGQTVTSEDERIEYYCVEIGNDGVESIRAVLPYLTSCTYFLMDGCGIDYEILAQLRDDFPETEIVWRIWLVDEDYNSRLYLRCGSYLTDTYRIRTTYVTDENSHLLNYCTKTKYIDVGHVWQLTQCDFLTYMPDLEVLIIAITEITDITPLANHEKLEYLELFTTDIEDLSPLESCPNIEHLNISNMPNVKDISPLYSLKHLKRLRMVDSPLIPEEQKKEIAEILPDCEMLNMGHWATAWFWRYDGNHEKVERYALLCEQMEYEIDAVQYGIP